jgi:hypothetical protein
MRWTQGRMRYGRPSADDMGIVGEARGAGIAGPSVSLGGGTGGEVGGEEGVQAAGRVIGHLAQPDAAGPSTTVLDFDGADDQDLALVAATATARQGSFLLRQVISVSSTSTRPASRPRSGASILQRSLAQSNHAVL